MESAFCLAALVVLLVTVVIWMVIELACLVISPFQRYLFAYVRPGRTTDAHIGDALDALEKMLYGIHLVTTGSLDPAINLPEDIQQQATELQGLMLR